MPFQLATVVSSNPINFVSAHCHWAGFWCKECTLIKLIGLLLTMWQAETAFIHAQFKLKRVNLGSRHCLTKCALENKLLNQNWWSWYHFSQEKLPQTPIPVTASTYRGKYAIVFFLGHPVFHNTTPYWLEVTWRKKSLDLTWLKQLCDLTWLEKTTTMTWLDLTCDSSKGDLLQNWFWYFVFHIHVLLVGW